MASVDGLITGMSTTDTINQLMKIEAAPQTALKTKISTASKVVSAYQSVNTRMASLATAAKALGDPATWGAMKATSNSAAVVVSAQAGAAAGSLSFRVDSLAAAHTVTFSDLGKTVASVDAPVLTADGKLSIRLADGTDEEVTLGSDASLKTVVATINGRDDAAYRAAAVQIAPGKYTLQLTAKETGAASAFPPPAGIDPAVLGGGNVVVQGSNAKLVVGTTSEYTIESAGNTFADVLPGVTVTATKTQPPGEQATIDVTADVEGIAAKVQAMVENANVALAEIASQSKTKNGDVAAGPLVGDSAMRKLSQDILAAVSSGVPGLGQNGGLASFRDVGIGVDRYGKLTFEKKDFVDAFKADPAKAQQYFTKHQPVDGGGLDKFEPGHDVAEGIGRKLEALALVASEGVIDPLNPTKTKQGTLQALIQRRNEAIKGLNDQVAEWDVRLETRRSALKLEFSNLEVALGKMQQQSSWLAGQLAGLA
jgi:flagellar hook-associated protein 2